MNKRTLTITGIILSLLIIITISVVWYIDHLNDLEMKAYEEDQKSKEQILSSINVQYEELYQKAVPIELLSVNGDTINFRIKNNTNRRELKRVRYNVLFRNTFGDQLGYYEIPLTFEAIGAVQPIKSGQSYIESYSLKGLSQLASGIIRYSKNLTASITVKELLFDNESSGIQFRLIPIRDYYINNEKEKLARFRNSILN